MNLQLCVPLTTNSWEEPHRSSRIELSVNHACRICIFFVAFRCICLFQRQTNVASKFSSYRFVWPAFPLPASVRKDLLVLSSVLLVYHKYDDGSYWESNQAGLLSQSAVHLGHNKANILNIFLNSIWISTTTLSVSPITFSFELFHWLMNTFNKCCWFGSLEYQWLPEFYLLCLGASFCFGEFTLAFWLEKTVSLWNQHLSTHRRIVQHLLYNILKFSVSLNLNKNVIVVDIKDYN